MTNLINGILTNNPEIKPVASQQTKGLNIDTSGSVKPLKDRGRLLPSRIIGSPAEYVKDLKKDIVNIGKASKGKANDHELGRLNDLAMKAGSLALAAYLFIKNPLKLSKTMEFVGFGTFFASMALWPKISIQAPLRARTGVDIHQKYIDSQGRKKMLFQDPQYDLTDMYSKEDLNRIGKKLKVSENIPDREKFIKQRAKKTAVQGNTLWMLSAGLANPVMSALACNVAEKPINKIIEQVSLVNSEKALNEFLNGNLKTNKQVINTLKELEKYLANNADKTVDNRLIEQIIKLLPDTNSVTMPEEIKKSIKKLADAQATKAPLNLDVLKSKLSKIFPDKFSLLTEEDLTGSVNDILNRIKEKYGIVLNNKQKNDFKKILKQANQDTVQPKLSVISENIKNLGESLGSLSNGRKYIDNYINARVGDKSGTYIANQWTKVCNKLIKSLKLNEKDLKALMNGDVTVMTSAIENMTAGDCKKYNKLLTKLMSYISDYEQKTGKEFITAVENSAKQVCESAKTALNDNGFETLAHNIKSENAAGTMENLINNYAKERALGAKSSFYRLIQLLDLIKQDKSGVLTDRVKQALEGKGKKVSTESVHRIVNACKKVLMESTPTDYVEKLTTSKFKLDADEYKIVMELLFGGSEATVKEALETTASGGNLQRALDGLKEYKSEFMKKVANWQSDMTPELSRRTVTTATHSMNGVERSNLAGKPMNEFLSEAAEQVFNSRKWLKIFGGIMIAVTAATLIIGLTFGRKSKAEKQAEEESKING